MWNEEEASLKQGTRAMHLSWNPLAGTNPAGEGCMQIVPPVMMINTLDSRTFSSGFASPMGSETVAAIVIIKVFSQGLNTNPDII
jgi:hypothetical protein